MRKRARLIFGLILLLVMAAAQAGAQARLTPRRLLLSVTRQPDARLTDNDARMVSQAILMRLQAASTEMLVTESEEEWKGEDESRLIGIAEAAQADCWLWISLGGGWEALTLTVRSYDLLSRALAVTLTLTREGWTSAHDLSLETWDDLTRPVAGYYHAVEAVAAEEAETTELLSIIALPGTVITGLGEPLVIGADGAGYREMPALREYTLRASLRGHFFMKKTIFLVDERLVDFDQTPDPRWTLDAVMQDRGNPGAGLTWYFDPGRTFLRLGATTSLIAIGLDGAEAFTSQPLSTPYVQWGWYFTREDAAVSLYAGIGGFFRVVHEMDTAVVIDALSPGGFTFIAGAEMPLSPRVLLFFEYAPSLYLTDVPELLRASLGAGSEYAGWAFDTWGAFNALSARFGIRWIL
jgi:hypothetical protein